MCLAGKVNGRAAILEVAIEASLREGPSLRPRLQWHCCGGHSAGCCPLSASFVAREKTSCVQLGNKTGALSSNVRCREVYQGYVRSAHAIATP